MGLTQELLTGRRFTRLKWLSHLLDREELDGSLRWRRRERQDPYVNVEERL
jgi:hypothetical protein